MLRRRWLRHEADAICHIDAIHTPLMIMLHAYYAMPPCLYAMPR